MDVEWHVSLYLIPAYIVGVTIHEFGHVAAGWLVGARGAEIHYGLRGRAVNLRIGPIKFVFHLGWGIIGRAWFTFQRGSNTPWKRLVVAAGGPLLSTICSLPLLVTEWGRSLQFGGRGEYLALSIWWLTVSALLPIRYYWMRGQPPADGLRMAWAVRDWWRQRGLPQHPTAPGA